jgi:hypothetical protein
MRNSTVISGGMGEGEAERRRAALLQMLQIRFGPPASNDLTEVIQSVNDSEALGRWCEIVLTANSYDAFRAAVQR